MIRCQDGCFEWLYRQDRIRNKQRRELVGVATIAEETWYIGLVKTILSSHKERWLNGRESLIELNVEGNGRRRRIGEKE